MTAVKERPKARASKPVRRTAVSRIYVALFAVVVILNLVGAVMVLSASSVTALREYGSSWYVFKRQLLWQALGVTVFVVALRVDYHRWRRLSLPLLIGAGGMLVAVLVPGVGVNVNGSSRWLGFGPLTVQPAEVAKLAVLLFVSDLLARRSAWVDDTRVTLRPVIVVLAAFAFLLMAQPNLGTTLVLAAIVFAVLFVAGTPLGPLTAWGTAGVSAAVLLSVTESYRRDRLFAFMHAWQDPLNKGYQTIQSQVSLASGGWFGVGLGASRAKWGFLPLAYTDFIFAIVGEELGLVGALLVVGLFVALGFLGVRVSLGAPDVFGRLVAAGITTWLCVQALVNIGAVVGAMPITGVPLPFLSFGGSSLLVLMAAVGILLNIARQSGGSDRVPARVQ